MSGLNASNASLNAHDARWEKQFAKLVAFQQRFGHCRVLNPWLEDRSLSNWLAAQRHAYWRGTLKPERQERLVAIGFAWRGRFKPQITWEEHLVELVAFKARFGHCNVPWRELEHRRLCNWVTAQRGLQAAGRLKPDRFARLEELGIKWHPAIPQPPDPKPPQMPSRIISPELEALNRRWEKRLADWRNGLWTVHQLPVF